MKKKKDGIYNNILLEEICDYCNKNTTYLDFFNCNHKICSICLLRRIFILNISQFNGSSNILRIKCNKCQDGTLSLSLDELIDLSSRKSRMISEINEMMIFGMNNDENKCKKHRLLKEFFCYDCCEFLCQKCENEKHLTHEIMAYDKVLKILKMEIKNIPLKFKTKDLFELNWNNICQKLKDSSQKILMKQSI